ncbi:hypothetical protein BURPS1710A_A0763 [Burkholderia pseudomallei 1710a]|uniref:Uncharacterized protein n=1 Tax=Burkholderia pseudomallei 1710a TaxID=320371 RepID=A0A0E1VU39_BURPE|nr:hypothetical protein BURPS1710A_A0763 [Burkholderia pseudomallei 1710a]
MHPPRTPFRLHHYQLGYCPYFAHFQATLLTEISLWKYYGQAVE